MRVKISNHISESTQPIHLQKIMPSPRKNLYQRCSEKREILILGFYTFYFVFVNMGPYGSKNSKQHFL